jgi:hypothetical protein
MTPTEWRRAQAMLRIEHALALIGQARGVVMEAASILADLEHASTQQSGLRDVCDVLSLAWRSTANLRGDPRVELDRDPTTEELAAAYKETPPTA